MKFCLGVLSLLLLLFFGGCNSIQVVDNTYGPMGGQYVKVSDSLTYLGSPNVYVPGVCVSDCPSLVGRNTKTRTDVFASKSGDNLDEVCVIERRMLIGAYHWTPVKGRFVNYADKGYVEEWRLLTDTDGDPYVQTYMNYLKSQGYGMNIKGVVVRVLVRNINNTNKIFIFYASSLDSIPETIREDPEKVKAYLTDKFDKQVHFLAS